MEDNFINHITVDSFGYDLYGFDGPKQIKETILSNTSVSITENVDFYITENLSSEFSANFDAIGIIIISASVNINVVTQASVGAIIMHPAAATISCSVDVEVYSTDRFSSSITEDSFNIKAFFILDDIPLSEHNRITSSSIQVLNTNASNWRGSKSVYYKTNGIKKTFNFQWSMLPGKRENTVDFNSGRDYVKTKAKDPRVHILEIRNIDTDGTTPYTTEVYNVLITEYSESLIRRDLVGDDYYWDCSLILQEV